MDVALAALDRAEGVTRRAAGRDRDPCSKSHVTGVGFIIAGVVRDPAVAISDQLAALFAVLVAPDLVTLDHHHVVVPVGEIGLYAIDEVWEHQPEIVMCGAHVPVVVDREEDVDLLLADVWVFTRASGGAGGVAGRVRGLGPGGVAGRRPDCGLVSRRLDAGRVTGGRWVAVGDGHVGGPRGAIRTAHLRVSLCGAHTFIRGWGAGGSSKK